MEPSSNSSNGQSDSSAEPVDLASVRELFLSQEWGRARRHLLDRMAALHRELVLSSDDRHAQLLRGQIIALSGVVDLAESIAYTFAASSPPPPGLADTGSVEEY